MSETTNRQVSSAIIYGIEDHPPFKEAFFAALQHLLAIFVAIITPPLIIAGALNLDLETTGSRFDGSFCFWCLDFYSI